MNFFQQKGEGRGNLIIGISVFLIATYVGFKVIPVMIRVYAFEDRVREECKFLHGRSMDALESDLIDAAALEELDVSEENITPKITRVDTYDVLTVKIDYTVLISTPVKVFEWNRNLEYQAPMFE